MQKATTILPRSATYLTIFTPKTQAKGTGNQTGAGTGGEHLTKPPSGYMVSPTDKKQWIVDEEAAIVVKRIFDLCIGGKGPMQTAKILKEDKALTAKAYYAKKKRNPYSDNPYDWRDSIEADCVEQDI